MILGGRVWQAEEALRFGLLSEVTSPEASCPERNNGRSVSPPATPRRLRLAKQAIDLAGGGRPGRGLFAAGRGPVVSTPQPARKRGGGLTLRDMVCRLKCSDPVSVPQGVK